LQNTVAFLIGGVNYEGVPTGLFDGLVDEVQIYNYALANRDVDFLFQSPGREIPTHDVTPPNPGCAPTPSGLVSWWKGDGNANDATGPDNGTPTGVSFTDGEVGQAFNFNGTDSQISFGNSVGNFDTNDFTIDFWMRTTSTRLESVMEKWPICGVSSMWNIRIGQPGANSGHLN